MDAIFEFDVATGKYLGDITETSAGVPLKGPSGQQSVALAVDSHGDLYAAVHEGRPVVDVWGPVGYYPTITLGAVTQRKRESELLDSVVLNGTVNPAQKGNTPAAAVEACYFQYVEEAAYEQALANKEEGFVGAEVAQCSPLASAIKTEPERQTPSKPRSKL